MVDKINGAPTQADYSEDQSRYASLSPQRGAPIEMHVRVDGTLNSNIDWKGMPSHERKGLEANLVGVANTYDKLKELHQEAVGKGLTGLANDLSKDMERIEDVLEKLKSTIEGGSSSNPNRMGDCVQVMKSLPAPDLNDAQARLDRTASSDAPDAGGSNEAMKQMEGSGKGNGASNVGATLLAMTPDDMLTHFSQNPETVWKEVTKLPPEERASVMQKLQMAVQEDNQMQSMLTNFMKAMHETAKATISNLRV